METGHQVLNGEFTSRSNTETSGGQKFKSENYKLIDCQVYNPFLASLGAVEIPRDKFIDLLNFKDKKQE